MTGESLIPEQDSQARSDYGFGRVWLNLEGEISMKHKRIKKFSLGALVLLALLCVSVCVQADNWTRYQNASTNNGVTENPAPSDADHAVLQWAVKMPGATTPPLVIGDVVYTASDNYVYCYDKTTGAELGRSDKLKGSVGFALHPMVYADNKLYVVTENGGTRIEALNLSDPTQPKRVWHSEPTPGTSYSPLTYQDGCLYTGTWNGEDSGYYFCVDAGSGKIRWSVENANGFYWDGAYATDTYVAFASENAKGGDSEEDGSALYTVNAKTGEPIDAVMDLKGNIRNTVVYADGYLYIGTVAGRVYRISVDSAGNLGDYSEENTDDFSYIDLDGRIKATMLVDQGQLYVGVEGKSSGSSFYQVIDCSQPFGQHSKIGKVSVPDEPKGAPILSTAEGGTRYVYFTCNDGKGGIYYFTNRYETEDLSNYSCLFQPDSSLQEKCISSLALDSEGTLYYTNDSNNLMAVSPKVIKNVEIEPSAGIHWKDQQFDPAVSSYDLTADAGVSEITLNVEMLDGENENVSSDCIVDGASQGTDTTVVLKEGTTTVELRVTRKKITLSYRFRIVKKNSQNASLSLLYYGQNFYAGGNLLPAIEDEKKDYSVDLRKTSANDAYLWILAEDTGANVEVYVVENIKDDFGDDLKKGDVLDPVYEEKTGELKYAITPTDAAKNTVIRVRVTSADGSKTQDYQVEFVRADVHHHDWAEAWKYDASYHWHECLIENCDAVKNSQKDGYKEHSGSWVTTRKATCTAAGQQTFTCKVCGYTAKKTIPATGHKYGSWKTSKKATVFAAETQKRTCSVCKYAASRTVGKKLTPVLEVPGKLSSLSIKKGATVGFTLSMAAGDSVSSVKSNNTKYVQVSSYSKSGSVKLKAVKTGTTSISIKLASGKSRTYSVKVVSGTVKTTKVAVDSTKLTLAKGKTSTLKPTVTPFTSTQKVTYKSSNKKVATVTSGGKITAVGAGTANITITSGSKKTTVAVTVPGISLEKTSVTIKRNKTFTLSPKRYAVSGKITYVSSNKNIATVSEKGKVKGIRKGTATITVKAGTYSVKCTVKVK